MKRGTPAPLVSGAAGLVPATTASHPNQGQERLRDALAVESFAIDHVPESARHGSVANQGKFWFLSNFQFYSIALGFIGPSMGLSVGYTSLAAIIGVLGGTVFTAFHAAQGPQMGLPQMVQSRAQFGYRGVVIPIFGALFTFIGFNVVDSILISHGLNSVFGWDSTLITVGLALGAGLLAAFGYDLLHVAFRVMFWISLPFYILLSIAIAHGSILATQHPHSGFNAIAFASQFTASFAYNITYAPCVSDYTRYLPRRTPAWGLIMSVYLGATLSALWLIVIGAWLGAYLGTSDSLAGLNVAGNEMLPHFGTLMTLCSAIALASTMGLNAYSAMLNAITGLDCFTSLRAGRALRIAGIGVVSLIALAIALALGTDSLRALYASLSLILCVLVPWTAVNLVDYFILRRGDFAIGELFHPRGLYGTWNWRGILSYGLGFAASLPFFVLDGHFEGPIAARLGHVDISWAPALLVSGLLYYVLGLKSRQRHRRQ